VSLSPSAAETPGTLLFYEYFAFVASNDANLEYLGLVATGYIDFSVTPFSVIAASNGGSPGNLATYNGWVEGNTVTWGFSITSGVMHKGDIGYVGGVDATVSSSGLKLRMLKVTVTGGDRFGNPTAGRNSGMFGNTGNDADGFAVFNKSISLITNTTVPSDSIWYGSAIGNAIASTGPSYTLPYNDRYNGGLVQTGTYLAPAAVQGSRTRQSGGKFNSLTRTWITPRTWANTATGPASTSGITIV